MASKRLIKEIYEQFLVCKICLEPYKQPKSLACLHIFCTECLEKHVEADCERTFRYLQYDRNIVCPICRKKTDLPTGGVRRLPESFLIANLHQVLQRRRMSAQMPSCQICRSRVHLPRQNATAKCLECYKFLCEDCVTLHRRTRVTRGHSLIEVGGEKDIECKVHQEEMVRFYCEPCEQCVCIVCMFQGHKGHEVSSFRDSIERHQHSLDNLLDTCRDRLYVLKDRLDLIAKCEATLQNSETQIRDSVIESITSIRKRERDMIQGLHDVYGQETMDFIQNKEAIKDMVDNMSSTCNVTEVIVRNKGIELLLLKREIQDKLTLLLEKSMQSPPLNANLQVYFVPGSVILGHLSVNGMGMDAAAANSRCITAGGMETPMMTDTDAGCTASGPCPHVPVWNPRPTDAGTTAMTNSFTMTIEPEMYESQTMTDIVDVVKKKVQTEPVEVREAGVETVRVVSSNVYTNTPETLLCDRSTHTKQINFTDKLTDTNGLVILNDKNTGMVSTAMLSASTATEDTVVLNKSIGTDMRETADKMISTNKVYLYDQFTCTPRVVMQDMASQARLYGNDKNVATRTIVTQDHSVGDHNALTNDQACETCNDLLTDLIYGYRSKDIVDSCTMYDTPMIIDRASSPVIFTDPNEQKNKILQHTAMETEKYILSRGINCMIPMDLGMERPQNEPTCKEIEIQTDWSIDTNIILPSNYHNKPKWKDFGVPEEPELCASIEHQHLVHCCCGPDGPMSLREPVNLSNYKLIVPTSDTSMCTATQEMKHVYTDMGVDSEMEDIMYAVMSGWDSCGRRSSSSASRRSSIVTKSYVDRSTNTAHQSSSDQETNTCQPELEDRGTGTPQVITLSKNVATTIVETSDHATATYIPTVEKATYMVQPVYLTTGTSTPTPMTSNKKVNTSQVETRNWSSMTSSIKMCDSQTSMETSLESEKRKRSFGTSGNMDYDVRAKKGIDTSTMTHIETADVAILKRPHTLSRSVNTPRIRTYERETSMETPRMRDICSMTSPVVILEDPSRKMLVDRETSPLRFPGSNKATATPRLTLRSQHTCTNVAQATQSTCTEVHTIDRECTPVRFPGHDQSVMVVPESSSKGTSVCPDTHNKASGTIRVIHTDTGIGTNRVTFIDKETCTAQVHRLHKNTSTETQKTADKQTATLDISAAYRDLISQEGSRRTCTRGTCTEPEVSKITTVDKGSSPLKLVRTRDKGIMVNKASFMECDDKFQKAGSMSNRLSDSLEGELYFVPSLESITESLKEQTSEDDDSSSDVATPPINHKERLWNVTPNGSASYSRDSMFSVNAGVQSTLIKCCVETGTSTRNISMEDKAISTESIVVDGRMAECISKLRTVRQRLENQPSSSAGSAISTFASVAPLPLYSRASITCSQPATLPSTATADAACLCESSRSSDVTTVTTIHRRSRLAGDKVPTAPIQIPAPSSPLLAGLDSPTLRSKARKFKLNMTQMLSNSPSEEDSPPTPPTSKSKMRGPMYGRRVEKKGLPGFRKEKVASGSPTCSSPEVSSPERLREKLESVPELLQQFRTGKSERPSNRSRFLEKNRQRMGNFDDVKLGRGIIPVGGEKRSRDLTPPPALQRGDTKQQRLMTSPSSPRVSERSAREPRKPRPNAVNDIEVEIDNLRESDV